MYNLLSAKPSDDNVAREPEDFSHILLATTMESCPDAILVVDAAAHVLSFNRRFMEMWAIPAELIAAGEDGPVLQLVASQMKDPDGFVERVRYLYQHPELSGHDELETQDGRTIDRHSAALRNALDLYLGRVWFLRDISERKAAEREIAELASTDVLTRLANRRTFLEHLNHSFAAARRGGNTFAVLYLDLDRFKAINDNLGHAAGDELLRSVADRLCATVRATDIVARFGGDEFAVLLIGASGLGEIAGVAHKIADALASPCMIAGHETKVTASIGVSPYFETTECPEVILRQADLALYRAKADGRDRVCFHSSDLDEFAKDHDSLISDLRLAVRRNELDVYFQPQVAIATGEIVGMEALARWKHPMRGMISPSVFIPIAEKCHVIAELGHWVLDNACQQIKRWKELGLVPPVVAVNVSALQLRLADEFVLDLQRTLEFWGVAPSALELDIAEPVWAEMAQSGSETIGRLTQLGVGIALDDFGAAGGSMSYLWTNQVQHIKIAPELIEAMLQRPSEAAVVRKIFFLAHLLGIDVIAECVETEAQRAFLLSGMATVNAQGYLYSRAVSPDEAVELIRRHTIAPAGGSQQ